MKLNAMLLAALCLLAGGGVRSAPRYDALGASDAVGVGASSPDVSGLGQPNNGYVYRINAWLHARYTHWALDNHGVNGYTAPDLLTYELPPTVAVRPAIVTVWVGGNDIKNALLAGKTTATTKAEFEAAYAPLIQQLRQQTPAFIITGNLPDMSRIPCAAYLTTQQRQWAAATTVAVNEVITRISAQYNAPVVEIYSDPQSYNTANFYVDGFHPNDAGYLLMAQKFEAILSANAWRIVSGLGDVDDDGAVSASDAGRAMAIAGGLTIPSDRQAVAADVFPAGGNSRAGIDDAVGILRRVAGLVPDNQWR